MKLLKMKTNLTLVLGFILTLSLAACSKTTTVLGKRTPPGQIKKQSAPGQMKKTTGSKSAKPYAPGQQKKKTTK